jgi:pyruvate kinase
MNIARLNFSHGSFDQHAEVIDRIRAASKATDRRVAIMGDLPGPKMRLGTIQPDSVQLVSSDTFTLTSEDITGSARRVSMSFEPLPRVVKPGDRPFLNDGLVQLIVDQVEGKEVRCTVAVGGELRSRKGLNLPGINLGISAFTDHDRKCLEFALTCGVDAVSQSFVESSADIGMVRAANAILDGTDCVMLSGESATGNFPEESVAMLAKIATFTEVHRPRGSLALQQEMGEILVNPKAMLVERALEVAPCDAVLVPTRDGTTARAVGAVESTGLGGGGWFRACSHAGVGVFVRGAPGGSGGGT